MSTRRSAQRQVARRRTRRAAKNRTNVFLIVLLLVLLVLIVLLYIPPVFYLTPLVILALLLVGWVGWRLWPRTQTRKVPQRRVREEVRLVQSAVVGLTQSTRYSLDYLLSLTDRQFEEFVGVVMEIAYEHTHAQRVGKSGDEGADIFTNDPFGLRVVMQCKKWKPSSKVPSGEVQKLWAAINHHDARGGGWFVTTSTFTKPAKDYAHPHSGTIRLLDGPSLVEVCQRYQQELDQMWPQRLVTML